MRAPIEWLPADGRPEQLILLLHGRGDTAAGMLPLAQALRSEFPQAAIVAPDAPQPATGEPQGRQWFAPVATLDDEQLAAAAAAAWPPLQRWIVETQQRLGVGPAATAIAGFSQGGIMALEAALCDDGRAGRVLAFGARFARLPTTAPCHTTVHLFHGSADTVIASRHAAVALQTLGALHGDATLDVAEGIGHELHPVLVARALHRLRNHIPARTWAAALGALPPGARTPPATH